LPYRIEFLSEAAQDWRNLEGSARKRLKNAVERLKRNPADYGKPLAAPLHGLRRIRSGDYRIVYRINEAAHVVEVAVICHRRDVYDIANQRGLA
jgi:mRNA interferase RelE/StbE